ncbi:MAG: hypothetical protein RBT64_01235 [Trichloromonas sp.]|nr:hypothetical protein [Trichloromonas sp.]
MEMMMKKWESYEDVARELIRQFKAEFGLVDVEGKQDIPGKSGTSWEIEAKGIKEGESGFVIVECRRYTTSRLKQESMAGLAFRISDTGASGGIVITPIGLQEGAQKVARSSGIETIILTPDSTTTNYVMQYLQKIMVGITETATVSDSVHDDIIHARNRETS